MTSPTLHSVIKQVGDLSDEDLSIFFNATESTGDAYNFATPNVRKWFKTSFAEAVDDGLLQVDFPWLETYCTSYEPELAKELLAKFFGDAEKALVVYVQKHLSALAHAETCDTWLFIKSHLKLYTTRQAGLCTNLRASVKEYGKALDDLCAALPETAGAKEADSLLETLDTVEEIKKRYYCDNDDPPPFEETIFGRCLEAYHAIAKDQPLSPVLAFMQSKEGSALKMIDTTEHDHEFHDAPWLETVREAYDTALKEKETAEPPAKKARQ